MLAEHLFTSSSSWYVLQSRTLSRSAFENWILSRKNDFFLNSDLVAAAQWQTADFDWTPSASGTRLPSPRVWRWLRPFVQVQFDTFGGIALTAFRSSPYIKFVRLSKNLRWTMQTIPSLILCRDGFQVFLFHFGVSRLQILQLPALDQSFLCVLLLHFQHVLPQSF